MINRKNILIHLLEKQFNLCDKTIEDAILDPNWKNWKVKNEKYEEFKKYAIKKIQKVFKCNRAKAIHIFEWFENRFGIIKH